MLKICDMINCYVFKCARQAYTGHYWRRDQDKS